MSREPLLIKCIKWCCFLEGFINQCLSVDLPKHQHLPDKSAIASLKDIWHSSELLVAPLNLWWCCVGIHYSTACSEELPSCWVLVELSLYRMEKAWLLGTSRLCLGPPPRPRSPSSLLPRPTAMSYKIRPSPSNTCRDHRVWDFLQLNPTHTSSSQ